MLASIALSLPLSLSLSLSLSLARSLAHRTLVLSPPLPQVWAALEDISACVPMLMKMEGDSPDTDMLWGEIMRYFKEDSLMACSCHKPSLCAGTGLVASHAYALLRPVEITTIDGSTVQLLHVRNPWGHGGEWNGDWSDSSSTWGTVDAGTKAEIGYADTDDGTFYIELADFCRFFDTLDVGRTLATNPRWSSATFPVPITAEMLAAGRHHSWKDCVDLPQYQVVLEGDAPQELVVTVTGPSPRVVASIAPRGSRAPPTPRLVLLVSSALDEGARYGPKAKGATVLNERITRWDKRTATYCFPNTPPGCYNVMPISDRPGTLCLRVFTDGPSHVTEVSGCEFSTAAKPMPKPQPKATPSTGGAMSDLAAIWVEKLDTGSGRNYYTNASTGETSWTKPVGGAGGSGGGGLAAGWVEKLDLSSGRNYYTNASTGETSWTKPVATPPSPPPGGKPTAGSGGGSGPLLPAGDPPLQPISPGTFDFDLADQSAVLSDLSWATSKLHLVRSSDVAAMSGGHRFFLLSMPKYTNTTVTLATTGGASPLGLYALTFGPADVEVPPNTKRVISKEASIKGSGIRKVNAMALNHPYALLIGVCGGKGVCAGSFRLTVEVKKR